VKELIKQILKEEISLKVRRLINFDNMDDIVKKKKVVKFQKDRPVETSIAATIQAVAHELMGNQLDKLEDEEYWKEYDELKKFLTDTFEEELTEYFEKRKRDADEETNPLELKYVFVKHDKPYYDRGWRGFTDSFKSFDDMITRYGDWVDVDWDEIKKKLDTINDFPDNQFNGWYYSRPLRIKSVGDKGNKWGYNFSVIKAIPYENLDKILKESKDSKEKTIKLRKEGLHGTSWENDEGDKITLIDLLDATEEIPVQKISVEQLRPHVLSWDGDEEEIKKIEKSNLQYPILIFVEDDGSFISIIDGHHRAQKALRKGLETIKAKIIPISSLPKNIRKVFSHMGKQEQTEGELTERCWKGYTQKGMKTMFGKRYPNCVKVKK